MEKRRNFIAWQFLTPALIFYIVFVIYPAFNAFRVSFYKWSGFSKNMEFTGFKNFARLFTDGDFLLSLKNTLLLMAVGGIAVFTIAFLFSIFLNSGIRGKKLYRNIIFFPFIVAPVIHSLYWGLLVFSPSSGLLNQLGKLLNIKLLQDFIFLDTKHMFWSALFVLVWVNVGFYLILIMAGIERIPKDLYESAILEGMNEFQMFFKITLPLLKEVLAVAIIFWCINSIKHFELFYSFKGIIPPRELWTNAIYIYVIGFGHLTPIYQLGYATAIAVFTFILIIIVAVIIRKVIRRQDYEY